MWESLRSRRDLPLQACHSRHHAARDCSPQRTTSAMIFLACGQNPSSAVPSARPLCHRTKASTPCSCLRLRATRSASAPRDSKPTPARRMCTAQLLDRRRGEAAHVPSHLRARGRGIRSSRDMPDLLRDPQGVIGRRRGSARVLRDDRTRRTDGQARGTVAASSGRDPRNRGRTWAPPSLFRNSARADEEHRSSGPPGMTPDGSFGSAGSSRGRTGPDRDSLRQSARRCRKGDAERPCHDPGTGGPPSQMALVSTRSPA